MFKHVWFIFLLMWGYGTFNPVAPTPASNLNPAVSAEEGTIRGFDTLTGPIGGSGSGSGSGSGGG